MSDLYVNLQAPNGRKWSQPIGLFINNEIVPSSKGQLLESIDPAYVWFWFSFFSMLTS